jgi:hypothetical protein
MQVAPHLTMRYMSSHVTNATLNCAKVITKLRCSSLAYVLGAIADLHEDAPQPKHPQVKCPTSKVYMAWLQDLKAKCPPPSV